jgi:signal transduction histidine kinase/CheY-like chemotaxis protein
VVSPAPPGQADRFGRTLDWSVLDEVVPGGPVVRLGPAELSRSPRFASADGAVLVLCAPARIVSGTKVPAVLGLWFAQGRQAADDVVRECAELLGALAELGRVGRARAEASSLEELGRRAAHLAHDLRHLLTVSRLALARACIEGGGGEALARELDPLLLAASDLCGGALHGDDRALARSRGPEVSAELLPELQAAVRTATGAAGRDDVRVRVSCPAGVTVPGARATVMRLFVNLTLNAIEASPTDRPTSDVQIEAELEGERVAVRVIDEGPGEEHKRLALERAHRLPGEFSASGRRGRGFGLDSVRAAVADLGGTIRASAHTLPRGGGSAIEVSLPRVFATELAGVEVVLVDADEQRRSAVERALSEKGTTVVAVGEPQAALELLCSGSGRPSVVAISRGTPGTGLGRLVQRARHQAIPCVALTSGDASARADEVLGARDT